MQALLTNIELDIRELKYLMDAFSREPNGPLRDLLKRNILQTRARLDQLLLELDVVQIPVEELMEPVRTEEQQVEVQVKERLSVEMQEDVSMPVEESIAESQSQTEVQAEEKVQNSSTPILGERIWSAADLRRSISLNDSFRFSRELFNGDSEQMNRVIGQISEMSSLNTAMVFLHSKVNVDEENEAMVDFVELLKKHFD